MAEFLHAIRVDAGAAVLLMPSGDFARVEVSSDSGETEGSEEAVESLDAALEGLFGRLWSPGEAAEVATVLVPRARGTARLRLAARFDLAEYPSRSFRRLPACVRGPLARRGVVGARFEADRVCWVIDVARLPRGGRE